MSREYGKTKVKVLFTDGIYRGFNLGDIIEVWSSHGDETEQIPPGYLVSAISEARVIASFERIPQGTFSMLVDKTFVGKPMESEQYLDPANWEEISIQGKGLEAA